MNYQNFFEVFFKKVFFESGRFKFPNFVQYFNSSAFLSRKRVQKYCFTAYPPNFHNTFFILFCILYPKSLILKRCRTAGFEYYRYHSIECCTLLFIRAHVYRGFPENNLHFIHPKDKLQIHNK